MILYAGVGLLAGFGCVACSAISAVGFAGRLRKAFFAKIQTFSFEDLDRFKTSSLITRMTNDVAQMQQVTMMGQRMLYRAPFMSIGGMIMAYRLSPSLAMILLVSIPALLGVTVFLLSRAIPLFTIMQGKMDRINEIVRENILGVKVVKSFVSQDREAARFNIANKDLMNSGMRASRNMSLLFPLTLLISNLSVVAVLWIGGNMSMVGGIEIGKVIAFINYLLQIINSLTMMMMMNMFISRAKVAATRINAVLDTEPGIKDASSPGAGIYAGTVPDTAADSGAGAVEAAGYDIEFRDVSFKYHGASAFALKNISFKIPEGRTIGILGTTGSGKSTLVSLIPRLYEATEGSVLIGGLDVRAYPQSVLRSKIGLVLQENILFSGSIEENLRFGKESATQSEMREAAEDAQALGFILEKERGFDTYVEQRARNFSGGQKQRLSIARTLLRKPDILILDDAASAVDMVTEARIREAINRRIGSCTVIIIAQRIAAIKDADEIFVMNEGAIEAIGTHERLILESEIYRNIVAAQMGEEAVAHAG